MNNQKPGQLVVTPGAKFDKNQIGSPVGLFNPDGSEFIGGPDGSINGGGWQKTPPYQNIMMYVDSLDDFDEYVLNDGHAYPLGDGWHITAYDGTGSKTYTTTGPGLAMVFDEDIQPTVDSVIFSRVFSDVTGGGYVTSGGLRVWYYGNDNLLTTPHYWVIEGTTKNVTDTNVSIFNKDICTVNVTENVLIECITNPDQPSNEFIFNRIDDGTYSATLSGVTVNGNPSPEVPFGLSILKDLTGEGNGYAWLHSTAGLPSVALGAGAGTLPSVVDLVGSDHSGMITFTTGTGCVVGEILDVTLSNVTGSKFVVEISAANTNALSAIGQILCSPDLIDGETWSISTTNTELDDATEYSFFYSIHKFYN